MERFFQVAMQEHRDKLALERRLERQEKEPAEYADVSTKDLFRQVIRSSPEMLEAALDEYFRQRGRRLQDAANAKRLQLELAVAEENRDIMRTAIEQLVEREVVTPAQLNALTDAQGKPLGLDVQWVGGRASVEPSPKAAPKAAPAPAAPAPAPAKRRIAPRVLPN